MSSSSQKLGRPCRLVYQHDGTLRSLSTTVTSVTPVTSLSDDERALFRQVEDGDSIVETEETVFHVQGGGQPSDVGSMVSEGKEEGIPFSVTNVRHGSGHRILHLGRFTDQNSFAPAARVKQSVDEATRRLHSRFHTAGHILGLATRSLSASATDPPASTTKFFPVTEGSQILPAIEELKASHHPGMAFDEYKGLLAGEHKAALQKRCDEIVAMDLPIKIHWWEEDEIHERCCSVMDSIAGLLEVAETGEKAGKMVARVMEVEGLGAYPCGGTHVATTKDVGRVVIRNIKRSKGQTKVTYEIADSLP